QQRPEEHAQASTAKASSSRNGKTTIPPVIGSLPASAPSRSPVSSRSATTTYSVPRRRSATRRRSRTAHSKASSASGVRLVNSRIVATGPPLPDRHPPGRPGDHAADDGGGGRPGALQPGHQSRPAIGRPRDQQAPRALSRRP